MKMNLLLLSLCAKKIAKNSIVKIVSCSKSVTPHDRQSDSKRDKRGGRETDSKGVAR